MQILMLAARKLKCVIDLVNGCSGSLHLTSSWAKGGSHGERTDPGMLLHPFLGDIANEHYKVE